MKHRIGYTMKSLRIFIPKRFTLCPLLLILFGLASQQAFTQEKITVFADEIPGLYEKEGGGIYAQVLTETLVKQGLAELKVLPPTRAKVGFKTCVNCCHTPGNKNPDFYDYGDEYIETEAISTAKIYIFTAAGQPVMRSLSELKGKQVGTRRGMPYGAKVESANLQLFPVSSIAQNIEKLSNGRIDAIIAYVPDAYAAFDALGMQQPLPHDQAHPIAVHPDALICKQVAPENIELINQLIKDFKTTARFNEIMAM